MRIKRWGFGALVVVLFLFGVMNLLAYMHAESMLNFTTSGEQVKSPEGMTFTEKAATLFTGIDAARPVSSPKDSLLIGFKQFSVPMDNMELGAALKPQPDTSDVVILFHGYRADKFAMLHEANAFFEMGYSVLLIDFRGSGSSSESYTSVGYYEAEEVKTSWEYVKNQLPHRKIILFGQSMGAAALFRAVAELDVKPDKIIAESVFDRMLSTVENRFALLNAPSFPSAQLLLFWGSEQMQFDGFQHNPIDYARSIDIPILFLHGEKDRRAKLSEARSVYDAVPETTRKEFFTFKNAAHISFARHYPEEWKVSIQLFLTH